MAEGVNLSLWVGGVEILWVMEFLIFRVVFPGLGKCRGRGHRHRIDTI